MGDEVTFQRLCEMLKFLRIGFKEEEARELFVELGNGRKDVSMSTTYQSSVLKDFLELESPPTDHSADSLTPKAPRFLHPSPSKSIPTIDEGLNVTSAEFTTETPKCPSSEESDPVAVYFVRDTVERFFSSGKERVSAEDVAEGLEKLPASLNRHDIKYIVLQAEDGSGFITRSSLSSFLYRYHAEFPGHSSPFLSALLARLRSLYGSFLTAYEELTLGRSTSLSTSKLHSTATALGLLCSEEDFKAAIGHSLSLQEFKALWLNNMRGTNEHYCTVETCPEPAVKSDPLCVKHKTATIKQGSKLWSQVKTSLPGNQRVKLMTTLQLHRGKASLSQQILRSLLLQYTPNQPIPSKDLSILENFLKLRVKRHRELSVTSTVIGKDLEMRGNSSPAFFAKAVRTPSAAGFGKSRPVSRNRGAESELRMRCFRFPYPGRRCKAGK